MFFPLEDHLLKFWAWEQSRIWRIWNKWSERIAEKSFDWAISRQVKEVMWLALLVQQKYAGSWRANCVARLLWLKACDPKTVITEPAARGKADFRVQAFRHSTQEPRGQTPRPREVKRITKLSALGISVLRIHSVNFRNEIDAWNLLLS